ncbi:UDP-3-O-acyl-N-acetylglucosamine deacetylase [Tautonia sociabilis]|uniref:Multifunctional fusion protein n=1 Tax=Tautonia sociabilis TaxID=2080755 RepID=A0A432MRY2_9BACT|nr:UDP-3-O-acyl-N-acetylglucosamine deacetylase [Tautonia sociabilis]RUL89747.1 UDP-3-O-[3-hydroxymyristoyl] N-acetylglucosamine deacetylase [Tautonia sociabilis]
MTTRGSRPQRTLAREAEVRGIGYLLGSDVTVRFRPAEADSGVTFVRADLPGRPSVPAHVRFVEPRERRTALRRGEAVVEMVEHVMAALAGLRIDNCLVELDAPETPGMDGSSLAFARAIASAGAIEQDRPRETLVIGQPVSVRDGKATVAAYPGDPDRLVLSYQLDYGESSPIPAQAYFAEPSPERFLELIAPARTFLLAAEAEALRAAGIGSRTSEADLLIFGPDGPIGNTLRFPDECARHKLLDLVGDLALVGKDLVGHVVAHRSGHTLNAELARALLAQESSRDPAEEPASSSAPEPEPPAMDINAIMRLMPHRYPFLLLDRVLAIEPGRSLRALKNVTCNEPFFLGHWPGRPVMPGVMILEAMAQAAGILISHRFDPDEHMAMIASIDDVKLRRQVVPGDQLLLEIDKFRCRSRMAEAHGLARVGDQVAAEARLRFAVVPIGALAA